MAAYCQVYAVIHFTPPAGWLPVHRDQLQAQRSVTSMGKTLPFLLKILVPQCSLRQPRFIHKKLPVSTPCTISLWWCWHAKSAVSTEMTQNKQHSHRSRLTVLQMTKQQPNCFLFMPAFTVTGLTTCTVQLYGRKSVWDIFECPSQVTKCDLNQKHHRKCILMVILPVNLG